MESKSTERKQGEGHVPWQWKGLSKHAINQKRIYIRI